MNIKGKIVTLRAIEESDLIKLHQYANDEEIQKGVGELHTPSSMAFHKEWLNRVSNDPNNIRLAVDTAEFGLVGMTTIINIDSRNRRAWHGLVIGEKRCRGKGIGLDAVMTTMKFAFEHLNLNRLDGSMLETNQPSIRLYCNKLGWSIEGTRRSYYFRDGRYYDQQIVGILRDEYYQKVQELNYWEASK
jgi:RimJ/RimL family protein N-acetyltransferase